MAHPGLAIGLLLTTIFSASIALAGEASVTSKPSAEPLGIVSSAPWGVYLDAYGQIGLDADEDERPDRFADQSNAERAATAWLRGKGDRDVFVGVAGIVVYRYSAGKRTVIIDWNAHESGRHALTEDMIPEGVVTIYVDAPTGTTSGNDAKDGRTSENAVATTVGASAAAYSVRKADPGAKLAILFRRGDSFEPWGFFQGTANGNSVGLNGTPEWSTLIADYGDGPRPLFKGDGAVTCFRNNGGFYHITFRNLAAKHTGSFVRGLTSGKNIKIIGCDLEAAGISLQASPGKSVDRVEIIDTRIYNCLSSGPHRSGIFLHYVKNAILHNVTLYRNGWHGEISWNDEGTALVTTPDAELRNSIFNHGMYAQYTCGPIRCENVVAMFNAGAGLQMRCGGDLINSYVSHNGQTGVVWGGEFDANASTELTQGEITGSVIVNHFAGGLIVNGSASGHIHDNLISNATTDLDGGKFTTTTMPRSVLLAGDHGVDAKANTRYGVNDLIVEKNRIGYVWAYNSGWGNIQDYFPGEPAPQVGVRFTANKVAEAFKTEDRPNPKPTFADPLGMYVIEDRASQEGEAFEWSLPNRLENEAGILNGTVTAKDLIRMTEVSD